MRSTLNTLWPRRLTAGLVSLACLVAGAGACKKAATTPPPALGLSLTPVADTRSQLIATVSVPSLEGTTARLGGLAKELQLPFGEADLRSLLLARSGVPPELVEHVNLGKPIGMAFLAGKNKGAEPIAALALSARSAEAARKLLAALGTRTGGKDDAVEIKRPDGRVVWALLRDGEAVIGSESLDGLVAAGAQALAARQAGSDDVSVTLYADALAHAQGTDVVTALADARKKMHDAFRDSVVQQGRTPSDAELASLQGAMEPLLQRAAETRAVDFALRVDIKRGLSLLSRVHPRSGSPFEKDVATVTPYVADPAVLGGPAPDMFFATGPSPFLLRFYGAYFAMLQASGIKGAGDLIEKQRAFVDMLTGAYSGAFRLARPPAEGLRYDVVVPLKPGVPPGAAVDAFGALVGSPALQALVAQTGGPATPKFTWKREGDTGRFDVSYGKKAPREMQQAMRALMGSDTLTAYVGASDARLLATVSPDGKRHLAALAAATPAAPSPEIAALLADTRGEEGVVSLDLFAFMRPALTAAGGKDPGAAQLSAMMTMVPGLAQLKLPIITTWRGGPSLTGELRVPRQTLADAAATLRPFMGMMGAGAPAGGVLTPGTP